MAKITNLNYKIKGERIAIPVFFVLKNGFHIKQSDLPDNFITLTNYTLFGYKSLEALKDAFDNAVIAYHEAIATQRKVIMFKIYLGEVTAKESFNNGSWISTRYKEFIPGRMRNTLGSYERACGFLIEWTSAIEATDKSNGKFEYKPIDKDGEISRYSTNTNGFTIIEWSEAREAFFKSIEKSIDGLILKMAQFFGMEDNALLTAIDSPSSNPLFLEHNQE